MSDPKQHPIVNALQPAGWSKFHHARNVFSEHLDKRFGLYVFHALLKKCGASQQKETTKRPVSENHIVAWREVLNPPPTPLPPTILPPSATATATE